MKRQTISNQTINRQTRIRPTALSVVCCLALLSCQTASLTHSQPGPSAQTPLLSAPARPFAAEVPSAQLKLRTSPTGQLQLTLQAHYPAEHLRFKQTDFKLKALNYSQFARFQVSIQGIGLTPPLYPAAADAGQNHTIAAANCTLAGGCHLNTSINNVPSGENRLAIIRAYDNTGQLIPGSTLATVFQVPLNQANVTVNLSYRSTPLAEIAEGLLNQNLNFLLAEMDSPAFQSKLDLLMGAGGTFPNFTYTHHPSLVNVSQLLNDYKTHKGDLSQLSATNPAYLQAGGTVSGSITGLVASDQVKIRLTDPATGQIQAQSNGNFQFTQVPPGTWKLEVEAPAGYTVTGVPANVTVQNNGSLNVGTITLTPTRPVVDSLSSAQAAGGQVLTINGSQFHSSPAGNTVQIAGVTIPSNQIEVVSSTQLKVTLPANLPLGPTTVAVATGTQQAVNAPALQILPAGPTPLQASNITTTSFDLTWGAVAGATEYRIYQNNVHVKTVAAPGLTESFSALTAATGYPMAVSAMVAGQESLRTPLTVYTQANWGANGWQTMGANTENVLAVATRLEAPERVYYGSEALAPSLGGIWRCLNGTCEAAPVADSTLAGSVQALAIEPNSSPQVIYAGSASKGVLKSTDGGDTWAAINNGLGTHLNVRSILVDPQQPQHVYVGTQTGGVFYSTNGGTSWTAVNTGLAATNIGSLSLYQPATGSPIIYAGTNGAGAYQATGGNPATMSWNSINNGLPTLGGLVFLAMVDVRAMVPHPQNSARQFAAGTGGCTIICQLLVPGTPAGGYLTGIWRRIEPADWAQIGHNGINEYDPEALSPNVNVGLTNMQVMDLDFDAVNSSKLYAATQAGIFASSNEGLLWSSISTGLPANLQINAIASHPLKLYIGTKQGLYQAQ